MKLEILDRAEQDLVEGFHFYEAQQVGLGSYFLVNLYADIESLNLYGGRHQKAYKNYHRLCLGAFLSLFFTKSAMTRFSFTQLWTAGAIPPGFGDDWNDSAD